MDTSPACRNPHRCGPAPLVWVSLASILGIFLDRAFALPLIGSLTVGLVSMLVFAWTDVASPALLGKTGSDEPGHIRFASRQIGVMVLIASLSASWHHLRWHMVDSLDIVRFASDQPRPCCLRGTIASGTVMREHRNPHASEQIEFVTSFELQVEAIRDGQEWRKAVGKCRVEIFAEAEMPLPGTSIEILGAIGRPRQARNPGDFDFRQELRSRGVHVVLRGETPECWRVRASRSPTLATRSASLRHSMHERIHLAIYRQLPAPDAALASAMLLGNRHEVDETSTVRFAQTGTSHLLSISGLHLGILAMPWFLLGRSGVLPMKAALVMAILFAWSFCWLIEFRTPVTRAAILISVFCSAKLLGRSALHWNTIALAALVVLAVNPAELFATGAQLSFIAVIAMSHLQQRSSHSPDRLEVLRQEARPHFVRKVNGLLRHAWWSVRLSGLVWLMTAPLVASHFHLLTPIAVIANPLTMLSITAALYCAVAAILVDIIWLPIGDLFTMPAHWGFSWLRLILNRSCQLPGAWYWTAGPPPWWLIGFYGGSLIHFGGWTNRLPQRWKIMLLGMWCVAGLIPDYIQFFQRMGFLSASHTECTFLDVGHGTAVVARLPNGQVFLYDAGSMGGEKLASERISRFLWHQRIRHLDAVFLSHADVDHYNGLPEIVDRFSVGVVYVEPSMLTRRIYPWEETRKRLNHFDVPLRALSAGSQWRLPSAIDDHQPNVSLAILHPPVRLQTESDNERSLVMDLSHDRKHLLLTGDIEGNALHQWITTNPDVADVIMAPHHGSGLVPIREIVRQLQPTTVVVSGGWSARSAEVLSRYRSEGAKTFHTATDGAVRVELRGASVVTRSWLTDSKQTQATQAEKQPRTGNDP